MTEEKDQSPSLQLTRVINQLLDSGAIAVLVTIIAGNEGVGAKLLVHEDGRTTGILGNSALDALVVNRARIFLESREETRAVSVREFGEEYPDPDVMLLFERLHPAPRLVVCGAGHVGSALARLGSFLGYNTTLIDDRADFVSPDKFTETQIELVIAQHWSTSVQQSIGSGKGVAVAVVTRGHNQDEECMQAVMEVNVDYVGLIGSKRRTNIVIENLRRQGIGEDQLQRIRAPIGLDIGAVTPEEVALAIIAEIVAERHGRKGESLSEWRRSQKPTFNRNAS
jgi:xanthine dehydrogenase accessory factor